jgi:hypothetical protein
MRIAIIVVMTRFRIGLLTAGCARPTVLLTSTAR